MREISPPDTQPAPSRAESPAAAQAAGPERDAEAQTSARQDSSSILAPSPSAEPHEAASAPTYTNSASDVSKWKDATEFFRQEVRQLEPGQSVMRPGMDLQSAMSALELMDPKMDAGMVQLDPTLPLSLEDALERSLLKISGFSVPERICLLDALLACLAAWLGGLPLSQTLFACLYLHKQPSLVVNDPLLGAVLTGILKICENIRMVVMRADVVFEEDFVHLTNGFDTCSDVLDSQALHHIDEVDRGLFNQARHLKSDLSNLGEQATDARTALTSELASLQALQARVKFFRNFLKAVVELEAPQCAQHERAASLLTEAKKNLLDIQASLSLGLGPGLLEQHIGQPLSSFTSPDSPSSFPSNPFISCFWVHANPPRASRIPTRADACADFQKLIDHLLVACKIDPSMNFNTLLDFFWRFNSLAPNSFARSRLFATFNQRRLVFGTRRFEELVATAVASYTNPPSLLPDDVSAFAADPAVKEAVNAILQQISKLVLPLFRFACVNRGRERRKLAHWFEEADALQQELESADSKLHSLIASKFPLESSLYMPQDLIFCFGSWLLQLKLTIMLRFFLLGFELQLYGPHEYGFIFRYCDYIASCGIRVMDSVLKFRHEQNALREEHATAHLSGKKKAKALEKEREKFLSSIDPALEITYGKLKVQQSLLKGLHTVYILLLREALVTPPQYEFDRESVRYFHRIAPVFYLHTPEPITYEIYKDQLASEMKVATPESLLAVAGDLFSLAKTFLETFLPAPATLSPAQTALPMNRRPGSLNSLFMLSSKLPESGVQEATSWLTVAKMNLIAVGLLRADRQSKIPSFEFKVNSCFPTLRIETKKRA